MNHRPERVGEEIKRTLVELLTYETQDSRLAGVTVMHVDVTGDLRRATAYVLPAHEASQTQEILSGLGHAQGYLRRRLAERLQLRFVPEIRFAVDQESPRAERVEHLLDELEDSELADRTNNHN